MEEKKNIIDVDFARKLQIIREGRCPSCGETTDFLADVNAMAWDPWELDYVEREGNCYLWVTVSSPEIISLYCRACKEKVTDEKVLGAIEDDLIEATQFMGIQAEVPCPDDSDE